MMNQNELKELLMFGGLFAGLNDETIKKKVAFIHKTIEASLKNTDLKFNFQEPEIRPEHQTMPNMPQMPKFNDSTHW